MKPDDQPAFPISYGGMTLRDYFAGQAVIGIVVSLEVGLSSAQAITEAAANAYRIADAMLAERDK